MAPRLIVRIGMDLGTSMSGYSYTFGDDPARVTVPGRLTTRDGYGMPKTATALLFRISTASNNWMLDCWGTEAVLRYQELQQHDANNYVLIRGKQFKLALSDKFKELPEAYSLPVNCPYTAQQLIALMLKCLSDHAEAHIPWPSGNSSTCDVYYCLSVPAGWSLKAKGVMRWAAQDAGLMGSRSHAGAADTARQRDQTSTGTAAAGAATRTVVLLHEQEAAALVACLDPVHAPHLQAAAGQTWIIVDAGGGTIDIAMHKVEEVPNRPSQLQLSEVTRSLCMLQGSSMLDDQMEETILRPLFVRQGAKNSYSGSSGGGGGYEQWKKDNPHDYIQLMSVWEQTKINFTGNNHGTFPAPFSLLEALWSFHNISPSMDPPGVTRGKVVISDEVMRHSVFDPLLDQILHHLTAMLSKPGKLGRTGADVMIMAGGFGGSAYLRQRVEAVCGHLLRGTPKVVVPQEAAAAVLRGNSIHLQRPDTIAARVARLTYGVAIGHPPAPDCSSRGGVIVTDRKGHQWCDNHFMPLVREGDVVRLGEETAPIMVYPKSGHTTATIPIYATTNRNAAHSTDAGMSNVREVKVQVNKRRGLFGKQSSEKYAIQLRFKFGATEMQVTAKDMTNNTLEVVQVSFHGDTSAPVVLAGA